ncbi:MAG: thioredoxin domain-containing protein [Chitinispirillales bacterium]|jgi:hypothetical protein|nr:thioredoxin domain-containing protein [Chitinispirillales bacterium]
MRIKVLIIIVTCAALCGAQRQSFVDSLQRNFHVESCCGSSIADCAKQKPHCTIAPRLITFLTWMDSVGRITNDRMAEALFDRYQTLTEKTTVSIKTEGWPTVGDPKSPLIIAMYFSATCPMCKTTYRDLHNAVTNGQLKGKAKLVSKPFSASEQNRALMAAHELNRFSDFMHALAQRGGRVDMNMINSIADNLKVDKRLFNILIDDPNLTKHIEQSIQEARDNNVTLVPTLFISGYRYNSFLGINFIIDAVEFRHENMKKN